MKKAVIMGMGDVLQGDHGAGCAVLEKTAETVTGDDIDFAYMGADTRFSCGYLYSADLAVLIGSLNLSGSPGTLHVWNDAIFRQHIRWMSEEFPIIHGLSEALARADFAGGYPGKMRFIFIEPLICEGYTLSDPVQKAVTKAVRLVFREISQWRMTAGKKHPSAMKPDWNMYSGKSNSTRFPRIVAQRNE